jgi:putative peptidoglycan lipid II flippase
MIGMPWLMYVIAPGFLSDPEKFELSVVMTRIAFPYLLCMSLVALLSGVLNALGRFTAAAAAPVLLNVVLIGALLLAQFAGLTNRPEAGIVLVWGVAVAGFAQLAMVAIAAYRAGMGLGFRRPRMTDDIRQLIKLGIPGIVAGGVMQINLQIGGIIASFADGARAALYYADRLYQLPVGIVGVAIGVVLLPEISRRLQQGDHKGVAESQNRSLEFALLFTLPATAGLVACAEPIVRTLFERGAFTPADTIATAGAVVAYAIGLPAFVIQKVLQPAFFAREDTATPMRFAWVTMAVNVIGAVGLFIGFQAMGYAPHLGIALATSIAAIVNAWLLWATLKRRGHFALDRPALRRLLTLVVGSIVLAVALYWLVKGPLAPLFLPRANLFQKLAGLGAILITGGVATLILAASIGMGVRGVLARIRNRRAP